MKSHSQFPLRFVMPVIGVSLLAFAAVQAFPPAPHHTIFGTVRDEMGEPLSLIGAQVILDTTNATPVQTIIAPGLEPGVNYEMHIPMDSGIQPDLYKSGALLSNVPFRLQVLVGSTVYLPLEMVGDLSLLGQPAERTRIDLTLGEDSDGDGIPDAWERALIAALGGGLTLADIDPDDDADGDGLTNLDEYHAGTYAFDPSEGFVLKLKGMTADSSIFEFLGVRGRTYSVIGSSDLDTWQAVEFALSSEGENASQRSFYVAESFEMVELNIPRMFGVSTNRFFRAVVQ